VEDLAHARCVHPAWLSSEPRLPRVGAGAGSPRCGGDGAAFSAAATRTRAVTAGAVDRVVGLATLTFDTTTGRILDVDLELNGTIDYAFEEAGVPGKYDLQSILTHEAGHMLGLAHSDVERSAMKATYDLGSIELRTITADDQAGVCAIYPNRAQRRTADGLVASTACDLAASESDGTCGEPRLFHGCSASAGAVPGGAASAAGASLLLAVGAVLMRASRSRYVAQRQLLG
jgi:hypothetical protein